MLRLSLNDEAAALLKQAVYAVEATSFEKQALMREHKEVEQVLTGGGMATVGSVMAAGELMAVTVEVHYGRYKGAVILFYSGCSQVVDHRMIRVWLEKHGFRQGQRTDAINFHSCLHHVDSLAQDLG